MDRRRFVITLILTALPMATTVVAQARRTYRIGLLTPNSPPLGRQHFGPFVEALRELGYEEGRNVVIDRRYADGRLEQFPMLVSDLLRDPLDVIVAAGPHAIRASQAASTTIPIVMAISHEPVAMGFVKSLPRPGGNTTGLAFQDSELGTKRLELLRETLPRVREIAAVWERSGAGIGGLRAAERAAKLLGLRLSVVEVTDARDLGPAFDSIKSANIGAVFQVASPLFSAHRTLLSELALRHKLPMSCETPAFVETGCLMAYGPSFVEMWRRAATYVDKILKGAKPADLPIEQPRKFDLVVNLRTAREIGITIPPSLLLRADQVIE